MAQETLTAAKCFAEAPDHVLHAIDKSTRLDMLDYFRAGVEKPSANIYEGVAMVTAESDASLSFTLTENVQAQMFVLNPDSPAPIIGYITTLPTPIPDSSVALFNSRWQPASPKILSLPTLAAWLTPDGKKHRAEVEDQLPFILASAAYDPQSLTLVFTNNMQQFYTPYDTPEALGWLKPSLSYRWNGSQFKLIDK